MMLAWLIAALLAGGLLAWMAGRVKPLYARLVSLASLAAAAALWAAILVLNIPGLGRGQFISEFKAAWIPQIGVGIHLAADGLSMAFVALTIVLGVVAVFGSWN